MDFNEDYIKRKLKGCHIYSLIYFEKIKLLEYAYLYKLPNLNKQKYKTCVINHSIKYRTMTITEVSLQGIH